MFSPCLSVLLVSEALFIYIVKSVSRLVRKSVWCSGNVIFYFFYTDGVYKIMKYLISQKYLFFLIN